MTLSYKCFLCLTAFIRYAVQDPFVKVWLARNGRYLLETFPLLFFCVSLEIKMINYPFHYKNCWSNVFQNQGMENKTADCILLSFTKKPSGLLQHWMPTLMLLVLHLQNPLQTAYGAKSAVVLHHVPPWSPSKGQVRVWQGQPCAQAVVSYWSKPFSWHKSQLSLKSMSLCSWGSPVRVLWKPAVGS